MWLLETTPSEARLFSIPKLIRLVRIVRLARKFEKYRQANVFRLFRLLTAIVLVAHWAACLFYVLLNVEPWDDKNWFRHRDLELEDSTFVYISYGTVAKCRGRPCPS